MDAAECPIALEKEVRPGRFPDGGAYRSLPLAGSRRLSRRLGRPLGEIERAALERGIVPERLVRNLHHYSVPDLLRLNASQAAVVGLGGLGGLSAELLARCGVGRLTLVDGDRFEESNLNRQILCTPGRLGRSKAAAAAARLERVNPALVVRSEARFLAADNARELLSGCQVALDCLDSLSARRLLADACQALRIPLVTAMLAGACGQLAVVMPAERGLPEALYGAPGAPDRGAETALGCPPQAVAVLAGLECAAALDLLLGRPSALAGSLLLFDLDRALFQPVRLA
jgi:molybdopterin/thiamine biosynthesis adenylyltransferase